MSVSPCARAWRRTGTRCMRELIDIQYDRNDMDFNRGYFPCARGCAGDHIRRSGSELLIRVEFFGDEIDRITEIDPLTGRDAERRWSMSRFSRRPIMLCRRSRSRRPAMNIEKELEEQSPLISRERISSWRRSVLQSGRILISKCCGRPDSVRVLRTIPGI